MTSLRSSLPAAGRTLLLAGTALALSACGFLDKDSKGDAPKGPVVAELDGQEITSLEVNDELRGTTIPPAMSRREAEKLALNNIITRRMLSKAAEERELHKKPEFLLQERRAAEQLRVQTLARDIAQKVVQPTRDEAEKFMNENPAMFAERKFFILDQIQFLRPDNINELGFPAAKTMAEVEAILNGNQIAFRRQPGSLDTLTANSDFVREVTKVLAANPDELFMFATRPQGAPAPVVLVNQVKETRVQPFTGDKAREFAVNYLRNQRVQNALKAEVEKQQASMKTRVVYQPGWEPAAKKPADPKALAGKPAPGAAAPTPAIAPTAAAPAAAAPAATQGGAPAPAPAG